MYIKELKEILAKCNDNDEVKLTLTYADSGNSKNVPVDRVDITNCINNITIHGRAYPKSRRS